MPDRWENLSQAVQDLDRILVLVHDDPDPDAVASGFGLCYLLREALGIEGEVAYRGIIGRAENRTMVDKLKLALRQLQQGENLQSVPIALVDTQPGTGNSPIPANQPIAVVVDHHSDLKGEAALFRDVRPWIGATATIITQYFRAAGVKPPMNIATALFYGIKTDTKALSRDTSAADVAAYFYLLPFVDVDKLVEIENAQVPPTYFRNLAHAMQSAAVYNGAVIAYLGQTGYPDLSAEMADLFLRLEGVQWVVCMGAYDGILHLSVRATEPDADAEELARAVIGEAGSSGGRNALAGGQVPLDGRDPMQVAEGIRKRVLNYLEIPSEVPGEPLIP